VDLWTKSVDDILASEPVREFGSRQALVSDALTVEVVVLFAIGDRGLFGTMKITQMIATVLRSPSSVADRERRSQTF
jgi:hypothetical protein